MILHFNLSYLNLWEMKPEKEKNDGVMIPPDVQSFNFVPQCYSIHRFFKQETSSLNASRWEKIILEFFLKKRSRKDLQKFHSNFSVLGSLHFKRFSLLPNLVCYNPFLVLYPENHPLTTKMLIYFHWKLWKGCFS